MKNRKILTNIFLVSVILVTVIPSVLKYTSGTIDTILTVLLAIATGVTTNLGFTQHEMSNITQDFAKNNTPENVRKVTDNMITQNPQVAYTPSQSDVFDSTLARLRDIVASNPGLKSWITQNPNLPCPTVTHDLKPSDILKKNNKTSD